MTVSGLGPTQASQLQSLAVSQVVDSAAASQASDQTASSVVKVASGMRLSGRTAESLNDIIQASKVNLGYSKAEIKSFTGMIDAARKYLDNIKLWASQEAAAAASTDPAKLAIDAHPTEQQQEQQRAVDAYDTDFIAKMEKGLDQVMSAFLDHKLVFQSFSIGATGNVALMANTFKTTADGKIETDLSFSFFQSRIEDEKKSQIKDPVKDPVEYGATWSVNDLRLFSKGQDRVL